MLVLHYIPLEGEEAPNSSYKYKIRSLDRDTVITHDGAYMLFSDTRFFLLTAVCCTVVVEFYLTVGTCEALWTHASVRLSIFFALASISAGVQTTGALLFRAESTCEEINKHQMPL